MFKGFFVVLKLLSGCETYRSRGGVRAFLMQMVEIIHIFMIYFIGSKR